MRILVVVGAVTFLCIWGFNALLGRDMGLPELPDAPAAAQGSAADGCWLHDDAPCEVAYSQCDDQWRNLPYGNGNICGVGCGPASVAMAITALTGKRVTPAQTAPLAMDLKQYVWGQGSSGTISAVLGKHYGLRTEAMSNAAGIKKALGAGGIVVIGGRGPAPFTGDGHVITIRALNENGTVVIGNPALPATNNRSWSLEREIMPFYTPGTSHALYRP